MYKPRILLGFSFFPAKTMNFWGTQLSGWTKIGSRNPRFRPLVGTHKLPFINPETCILDFIHRSVNQKKHIGTYHENVATLNESSQKIGATPKYLMKPNIKPSKGTNNKLEVLSLTSPPTTFATPRQRPEQWPIQKWWRKHLGLNLIGTSLVSPTPQNKMTNLECVLKIKAANLSLWGEFVWF